MKIVLAPNAFKGSLSAREAAHAMAVGARRVIDDAVLVKVPVADGGDGLVDVALEALGGELHRVTVTGPLGQPVDAALCFVAETGFAAIEMALASGLSLLPDEMRDATLTSTVGTGELIAAALDLGAKRIAVGIGGSATNDGGMGAASALGVRFLDEHGAPLAPVGANLGRVCSIDTSGLDERLEGVQIEAVCDVDNPLHGPDGAACVFAEQKGASPDQIRMLDAGLVNLAAVIKRDIGLDVAQLPGAGAAGGLAAGLLACLGATLRHGADLVLDLVGLHAHLRGADLVITGEGKIDAQTLHGKAPAAVAAAAQAADATCIVIAGRIGTDLGDPRAIGIEAVYPLSPLDLPLEESMRRAAALLTVATEKAVAAFVSAHGGAAPSGGD